jgi:hypothetical protein
MFNKISKTIIDTIRRKNTIIDYLGKLGINPSHDYGDKCSFLCPLPGHKDIKPSFFVYRNGEFENFWCWSCCVYGDVIELHRRIKNISYWTTAAKDFSEGAELTLDAEDEMKYSCESAVEQIFCDKGIDVEDIKSLPGKISLHISCTGLRHLKESKYDEQEFEFLEKLYQKVDTCIWENDIDGLLQIDMFLFSKSVKLKDGRIISPFEYRSILSEVCRLERLKDVMV